MPLLPAHRAVLPGTTAVRVNTATGHNGFPGLCVCADGSLLIAWRHATQHGTSLGSRGVVSRSVDGGRTWSPEQVVFQAPGIDAGLGMPTRLASGRIALLGTFGTDAGGRYVVATYSDDNGLTWTPPAPVPFTFGVWSFASGNIAELPDGTLVTMAYGVADDAAIYSSVRSMRSLDGGLTWGEEIVVADPNRYGPAFSEAHLGVLPDGTLMALLRGDFSRHVYRTTSFDGGLSWSIPELAFAGWGRPVWARLASGVMVVAYRRAGDDGHGIRVSVDDGVTWGPEQRMAPRGPSQSVYSGLEEVSPGVVAVAYADEDSPTVATVRFKYLLDTPTASPLGEVPTDDTGWRTDGLTAGAGWSLADASGYKGLAWRLKGGRVDASGIAVKAGSFAANEIIARLPEFLAPDRVHVRNGCRIYPDATVRIIAAGTGAVVVGVDYPL